jgi:YD repeat-containing protein
VQPHTDTLNQAHRYSSRCAAARTSPHADPGGDTAATWDKQDLPLREHAQAVARTLRAQ